MNEEEIQKFLEHPEECALYRGERSDNKGGLHFTNDEEWAGSFGNEILTGTLPAKSRIKLLVESDMSTAIANGIYKEQGLWDALFDQGYDAILGHDSMRSDMLDVVVNPKHLNRFKILEESAIRETEIEGKSRPSLE